MTAASALSLPCPPFSMLVDDAREHVAHEHRDDRRRRLVGAEAVIVVRLDAMPARSSPACSCTPSSTATRNEQEAQVLVRRLARLEQVLRRRDRADAVIAIDQLQCLPLPLMPANGFSWSRHARPWRSATLRSTSIASWLWSTAMFASSKIGAISNCDGRDLVVARLDRDAELVELVLHLRHERQDARRDASRSSGPRAAGPCGGWPPTSVRPAITRSGRSAKNARSIRKYSCSAPSVGTTRLTPVCRRSGASSSIACLREHLDRSGAAASSRRARRRGS